MGATDLQSAYAVLQLAPPISQAQLKRHYRRLVRRWHPDRYQTDPIAQAKATKKLREINAAYEIVAASLLSTDAVQTASTTNAAERTFSWSPDRVDSIVDSINRLNSWSLLPEMSLHRWLSVGAMLVYLLAVSIFIPSDIQQIRAIARAVVAASGYFWLPLYLIWSGDNASSISLERAARIFGWALMVLPAVVAGFLWLAN